MEMTGARRAPALAAAVASAATRHPRFLVFHGAEAERAAWSVALMAADLDDDDDDGFVSAIYAPNQQKSLGRLCGVSGGERLVRMHCFYAMVVLQFVHGGGCRRRWPGCWGEWRRDTMTPIDFFLEIWCSIYKEGENVVSRLSRIEE